MQRTMAQLDSWDQVMYHDDCWQLTGLILIFLLFQ